MNIPYTEALERALGRVVRETREECARQVELAKARADTVIARLEARSAELEARAAGLDRAVAEQVAAGIEAGLAAIKEAMPDDTPLLELTERVAEVEAREDTVIARLEARSAELEARAAGLDRAVAEQVAAGIEAGLAAIKEAMPDDTPLLELTERVAEVEAREPDLSPVTLRLDKIERVDFAAVAREIVKTGLDEYDATREKPAPPDMSHFVTHKELKEAIPAPVNMPDLSGFATREDLENVRADIPQIPEAKDWAPEIEAIGKSASEAVESMRETVAKAVENVAERLARHPGVFPRLKAYSDAVHYAGDLVVHGGATWQARRDTGRPPPHDDWSCIAAKGEVGSAGKSFTVRGTYSADEAYAALDVVMMDGSSFVAKQDDPGPCPGDGWQLAASRGGRGKPGENIKGDPGKPGLPLVGGEASPDGLITLTNGDGSTVEIDLYPVLSRLKP